MSCADGATPGWLGAALEKETEKRTALLVTRADEHGHAMVPAQLPGDFKPDAFAPAQTCAPSRARAQGGHSSARHGQTAHGGDHRHTDLPREAADKLIGTSALLRAKIGFESIDACQGSNRSALQVSGMLSA